MRIKRDTADKLFSDLVRERAGWCCESCQRYYPPGRRQGLHCSHIFSRRHNSTRWHPQNAIAECFACHQKGAGDPVEHFLALETIIGREAIDRMRILSSGTLKVPDFYKKQIIKNLRAAHKRMMQQREDGVTGRIDFSSPY